MNLKSICIYAQDTARDLGIEIDHNEIGKYYHKYKWHDLKANPKDLPKENDNYKRYLVMLEGGVYITVNFYDGWNCMCYDGKNLTDYEMKDVVKWKEIEEEE